MSEGYEPITGELRGKMDTLGWYDEDGNIVFTTGGTPVSEIACLAINSKAFERCCDAIDAVHAGLERENAELRQRVAELDNRGESMRETDAWKLGYDEGFASADDWMADNEDAMTEHGWVRLPLDADGVPIRVGDVMEGTCPSGKHVNGTVRAIGDGVFWLSNVQFSLKPDYMHHYHAPTVEDVLREMADRCYADEDEPRDRDAIVAEFAPKLRLAGDAE